MLAAVVLNRMPDKKYALGYRTSIQTTKITIAHLKSVNKISDNIPIKTLMIINGKPILSYFRVTIAKV